MDPAKRSHKSSSRSNKEHRLHINNKEKIPYGYVEDCCTKIIPSDVPVPNNSPSVRTLFHPVSIIVSTQNNILLSKDNAYTLRFSTGMLEGSGISINESGDQITFEDEGSYRFEICGDATPYSDVDVKLIFYSDAFSDDIKPFNETMVPKDEGKLKLRGLATILPIQHKQMIITRLVPTPDES